MVKHVSSPQNKIIKLAASLCEKKYRDVRGLFIVEGQNFVKEIEGGVEFHVVTESYLNERDGEFASEKDVFVLPDPLYAKIAGTATPQGILAVCRKPSATIEHLADGCGAALILALDGVSDPGNVGTLIRCADAFGASGVVLSKNCADVFSPKTVRASAGSVLRVPCVADADLPTCFDTFRQRKIKIAAAVLDGENFCFELDFRENYVIIIGNEARGISREIASLCDKTVKIPMSGAAESLNAAVAGGVLLFEAQRQRRNL